MKRHNYEALKRVERIRRRARQILTATENESMRELARLSLQVTERAIGILKHAAGARQNRIIAQVDDLLANASRQIERGALDLMDQVIDLSLAVGVEQLSTWNTVSGRQLAVLSQAFRADFRPDLRTEAYSAWIRRIPQDALAPEFALRDSLAQAIVEGRPLKSVVSSFLEKSTFDKRFDTAGQIMRTDVTLTNLPALQPFIRKGLLTEQKISPLKRAIRLMRTEIARVDNVVGITFAETAGFDHFVNTGVDDDRQSDICRDASEQAPMTIAEWIASIWGLAPRHVANCRCGMTATPATL